MMPTKKKKKKKKKKNFNSDAFLRRGSQAPDRLPFFQNAHQKKKGGEGTELCTKHKPACDQTVESFWCHKTPFGKAKGRYMLSWGDGGFFWFTKKFKIARHLLEDQTNCGPPLYRLQKK
eukprot:TRINITY_DN3753_c1_g1_i1.p1 TRINITY_DN3753_c1_g1~~TRINITY_DN3753_c1_g1_i1.p1  ORF type:complete len:119 (+),score=5.36 TRINITY_DN3753_c1_g1_i1:328-684(+)